MINFLSKITRLRTIKQCLIEMKSADSDTAITEWYINKSPPT